MTPEDQQSIRVSGNYATYRGQLEREVFAGNDWVAIPTRGRSRSEFPEALELGDSGNEEWVKLPKRALESRHTAHVTGRWQDVDVYVSSEVPGERVLISFVGPPAVATRLGMEGDQYMGWTKVVPASEVEIVDVQIKEFR